MTAIRIITKRGERTYTPAEPLLGGQVVEARAAGRIGVAAAGSAKVLGVAITDAVAPEAQTLTATVVDGRPVLNTALLPTIVTVVSNGDEVPVTFTAAAAFGDRLVATAGGKVGPAGATPDARTVIGVCVAPAGVAAGAVGPMRTA